MGKRKGLKEGRQKHVNGLGWYSKAQYEKLLEVADDADELFNKHAAWKESIEQGLRRMRREGLKLRRVDVDVDELVDWCSEQERPVDGEARARFIALKTRELEEHDKGSEQE